MKFAVYKIVYEPTGRVYVGSTGDMSRRWIHHRWHLKRGTHHSPSLQAYWKKYGREAFSFSVIEWVEDPDQLIAREQHWIDKLGAAKQRIGFNVAPVAGSRRGVPQSASVIEMQRQLAILRMADPVTRAAFSKIGAEANRGSKRTPEQRARMMAGHLARKAAGLLPPPRTPEHNEKIRKAHLARAAAKKLQEFPPEPKLRKSRVEEWAAPERHDHLVEAASLGGEAMRKRGHTEAEKEARRLWWQDPANVARVTSQTRGQTRSDETKAKLADKAREREAKKRAEREAGVAAPHANAGTKRSDEAKAKMRAAWARRKALATGINDLLD